MRRSIDARTFQSLTGRGDFADISPIEVDRALQNSFNEYVAGTALDRVHRRSNIRMSILPKELGIAVHEYTAKCMAAGGGEEVDLPKAFRQMCEEIARIL